MTRIIAGAAGGRVLRTPQGQGTRPTSDRVRESLFAVLEVQLAGFAGLHVLDLYAGSGALGLEALSRGAASATFVEKDRRAADVVLLNVRGLGLDAPYLVRPTSVSRFLDDPHGASTHVSTHGFDLVFYDPPYALGDAVVAAELAELSSLLAEAALVVVERSARSPQPAWPQGFAVQRSRRYGETAIHLAGWHEPHESDQPPDSKAQPIQQPIQQPRCSSE